MSTEDRRRALRAEIANRRAKLGALGRQREMAHDDLGRIESKLEALADLRPGNRPDGMDRRSKKGSYSVATP